MKTKAMLYGCIWLYICSPIMVAAISGLYLCTLFHPLVAIFLMLFVICFYWCCIWMPVRAKFYKLDKEFTEMVK